MIVEYKTFLDVRFWANTDKGQHWQVLNPFIFTVDGAEYTVPVEFWTDFASIPRIVWNIIDPYALGYGPVPHDFGYFTGIGTQEYWDRVFLTCMEKDKIPTWKRQSAYLAVRNFGGVVYNRYRKENAQHLMQKIMTKSLTPISWNRNVPLNQFVV